MNLFEQSEFSVADYELVKSLGVEKAVAAGVDVGKLNDDLMKAMNRAGLVQKEVTVRRKDGSVFTRKQWVRSGSKDDKGSKKKNDGNKKPQEGKEDKNMVPKDKQVHAKPTAEEQEHFDGMDQEDFDDLMYEYQYEKVIGDRLMKIGVGRVEAKRITDSISRYHAISDYTLPEIEKVKTDATVMYDPVTGFLNVDERHFDLDGEPL